MVLPPGIRAAFKNGMQIGDLEKVLPACKRMLDDGASQTLGAQNYLVVTLLSVTPVIPAIYRVLQIFVLPKIKALMDEFGVLPSPLFQGVLDHASKVSLFLEIISTILILSCLCYIGGHWVSRIFRWISVKGTDAVPFLFPWKKSRMQRNFVDLLAALLDAGVPEKLAVERASSSVDNFWFRKNTGRVLNSLQSGDSLPYALGFFDKKGELKWRMENAARGNLRFQNALEGWIGFLDAKSFQQEQAFAQLLSTGLVIFNGLFVGLLVAGSACHRTPNSCG